MTAKDVPHRVAVKPELHRQVEDPAPSLVGANEFGRLVSPKSALSLTTSASAWSPDTRRPAVLIGVSKELSPFVLFRGVGKKRDYLHCDLTTTTLPWSRTVSDTKCSGR